MPIKYILIFILLFGIIPLFAQPNGGSIQTIRNNEVINLVKDVFIKGNCKNVNNIEASGEPISFGQFENAGNILGLPDGIMLSTGDVLSAIGPNESVETTTSFANNSTDKDLIKIATNQLLDVTVLEFDFVPLADEVSFQYVFASEEYCEFVGTIFNDVFGFFVSGPGINGEFENGAINVAKLPDSEDFVSINTVNHILNSDIYVKNELEEDANNCLVTFSPDHLNTIEFDGFTTPLTARFEVIPCETYHIRLVVGDVGDDKLDSAVFLRSKSFNLGELASVKAVVPNRMDTIAYENCVDGQFVFSRPEGSDRNVPFPVDFIIDNNSSATEGIDFQPIERSITIPVGQNNFSLPIQSLMDNENENTETLIVDLQQTCQCEEGSQATLKIADPISPKLAFNKIDACTNQSFTIKPQLNNGVSPFTFQWNNGTTDSILTDLIQQPTKYYLTVTDFCQNQQTDSITINFQSIPIATLSGDTDYCEGKSNVFLPLNFNGNAPWSFSYAIDNGTPIEIENIFDVDYNLPVTQFGTYELLNFSDAACIGDATGIGIVNNVGLELEVETMLPSCPNIADGAIELKILNGQMPFSILWSTEVNDASAPTQLPAGDYSVTVIDAQDCIISESITLMNPNFIDIECENNSIYIPNAFSPNGDGVNDFFEIFLANNTTIQKINKVEIIDRWGNLVYSAKGIMPKWDGTFNGQPLNPAVFRYTIIVAINNSQTDVFQGTITLIK